jgi:hypothetical protein
MYNPNKTISVNSKGLVITFTDKNKHQFVKFEKRNDIRIIPTKCQEIEQPTFNNRQQKMYSEALYGLTMYSEQEIKKIPRPVLLKIVARSKAVQTLINRWKQEISNSSLDDLLIKIFPKSPIIKQFTSVKGYDDTIKNNMSFKDLGLNQKTIAIKLVEVGLLPKNFFNLV